MNFFDLYFDYQKNIGTNFLLIEEKEYGDLNSLPICYRPLYGIDLFIFKYKVLIRCNGICKFSKSLEQEKVTAPFLEFTEDYITNLNIKNP